MRQPRLASVIERRLLVNYRVDPAVVATLLPAPLRPQQVDGWAVAGICLIRLGRVRPHSVPGGFGLRSENAAHRIAVDVRETSQDLHVAYASRDGATRVSVDVAMADRFEGSTLFAGLGQASAFFQHGSVGFSAGRGGRRLDGMELATDSWRVEPVDVRTVRSTFFDDQDRFPSASVALDCALLMRDVSVTWNPLPTMPVSQAPDVLPMPNEAPSE